MSLPAMIVNVRFQVFHRQVGEFGRRVESAAEISFWTFRWGARMDRSEEELVVEVIDS